MTPISKWQRRFLTVLLTTVFAIRGRATFTNLARFCSLHEQTFRRHFQKFFDWVEFNLAVLLLSGSAEQVGTKQAPLIGALDCTFLGKSGKKSYGLDRFWSSASSLSERGLEVSVLALIQGGSGQAFTLDAAQTPPALLAESSGGYSCMDFYMEQLTDCLSSAPEQFSGVRTMRYWIFFCITLASLLFYAKDLQAQTSEADGGEGRPNIVWITAEDTSPSFIGAYGGAPARTPNIDQLAEDGVRYTNAFALNGACAPNRSALMTGLWPPSYGAQHMRTMKRTAAIDRVKDPELLAIPTYEAVPPPEVRLVPERLRARGYFATNNAKTDYQFIAPVWTWNESSDRATWRHRTNPDQPFFSVFNISVSHESFVWKNEDKPLKTNPDAVTVPPYYPDTPIVRRDLARYYDNVALMDKRVGRIVDQLRADGLLSETIVFFFSDHGTGLPRMKRTLYDSGLRVPLIVRVPEKYQAEVGAGVRGTTSNRLVSFLDFAPTLLSLTGTEVPAYMQGQPFLGPQESQEREYIYAHRDRMAPVLNTRRAVSDGRFKYIRDYRPEKPFLQFIPYRNRENHLMREILRYKEEGRLDSTQQWQWLVEEMPLQELYDTKNDPYEIRNLAGAPRYRSKLTELRRVERRWWRRTNDMGLIPEPVLKNILWPPLGEQPTTAAPSVREGSSGGTAKVVRLESNTRGASIGYKVDRSEAWQVYHEPLKLPEGDTLRAKAHRIGYKASPVTTWVPEP